MAQSEREGIFSTAASPHPRTLVAALGGYLTSRCRLEQIRRLLQRLRPSESLFQLSRTTRILEPYLCTELRWLEIFETGPLTAGNRSTDRGFFGMPKTLTFITALGPTYCVPPKCGGCAIQASMIVPAWTAISLNVVVSSSASECMSIDRAQVSKTNLSISAIPDLNTAKDYTGNAHQVSGTK